MMDKEALRDAIRTRVQQIGALALNEANTPELRRKLQEQLAGALGQMIAEGAIPSDVRPSLVRVEVVTHDQNAIDFVLPLRLVMYMSEGENSVRVRRFAHDCDGCKFLAHFDGCDLYACEQPFLGRTVVARRSSEPTDYISGVVLARYSTEDAPLYIAWRLATEELWGEV